MLIEIRKDKYLESRDFYTRTDGHDDPGYTKEGEFSDTVRYFLSENPDGEVFSILLFFC
jgi:hypothetical protein